MGFGTVLIVAAAFAALIMAGGIVDILRLGRVRFATAGKRRWHWILLIIYSGPLGVLLYAAAVRPQVAHPERYVDDQQNGLANGPSSAAVGGHAR